ncbi:MAG: hypothetical protein DRI36_00010 [Caldiserica bacterium]|nr:MAG: hypothetical protein DRI36_00010 [Caldisericota bacterium]
MIYIFLISLFFITSCAKKTEEREIVIWHWMTDREDAFSRLAQEFMVERGIKVKFELYAPSEVYSQKVRAAAQTNTLPDIFGILGSPRDFASFIKAGFVEDLTMYMEENNGKWKNSFYPQAIETVSFKDGNMYGVKPGIYGIPIDMMNIQMICNTEILKKAGIEKIPETWEEYVDAGRKLKKKGINVFVSGWGEVWLLEAMATSFAFNIMGPEKVFNTFKGEVPYTDPDWIKVFSLFDTMRKEGLFIKDSITMVNKTAEQMFANGRSAFTFNGSWCINVYKGMNPNLKYSPCLLPKVNRGNPVYIWGGSGSWFVVNSKSKYKKEAIEFLKWLTSSQQQKFLTEETMNLPSNKDAAEKLKGLLKEFALGMKYVTHPNFWPVHETPEVIEKFDKGIQLILIGKKTPFQVAKELDKYKKEQLKE